MFDSRKVISHGESKTNCKKTLHHMLLVPKKKPQFDSRPAVSNEQKGCTFGK